MKIYTKKGDDGTTGLLYGGRIDKNDVRAEAYGTIDELVAVLGVARATGPRADGLSELLLDIQRQLFVVGAELATAKENHHKLQDGVSKVTAEMVSTLEKEIDRMTSEAPLPDYFIVPGASDVSAIIDLARAVARRAERHVVEMARVDLLGDETILHYLNRLSDLLFVVARREEQARGVSAPPSRS